MEHIYHQFCNLVIDPHHEMVNYQYDTVLDYSSSSQMISASHEYEYFDTCPSFGLCLALYIFNQCSIVFFPLREASLLGNFPLDP